MTRRAGSPKTPKGSDWVDLVLGAATLVLIVLMAPYPPGLILYLIEAPFGLTRNQGDAVFFCCLLLAFGLLFVIIVRRRARFRNRSDPELLQDFN